MPDRQILFLCSCSNRKLAGGDPSYRPADSMPLAIPRRARDLLAARREAFSRIQGGATSVRSAVGAVLRDLPYNADLVSGPDFGGKGNGRYMPAMARYRGRFYDKIDPDERGALGETPHRLIIVSALYGLLTPGEPIQCYSCHIEDDAGIAGIWTNGGLLTSLLLEYVRVFDVGLIVDLTAEASYRRLFDWKKISGRAEVLWAFGAQNAGPALLPALGSLTRERLLQAPAEEMFGIEADQTYPTAYEDVMLTRSYLEPPKPFLSEPLADQELEQPTDGAVVEISIRDDLDGSIQKFGSRFWSTVRDNCRALKDQLDKGGSLREVRYSDRYVTTPWAMLLIREIMLDLVRREQADIGTGLRVFTRDLRRDARSLENSRQIKDSWQDNRAVESFFMKAFEEGRDRLRWKGSLKIETGGAPHFRELRLDWDDGVAWTLKLDQGVGYWRCKPLVKFPFHSKFCEQLQYFNGIINRCRVTSPDVDSTYIHVAQA